MHHLLLIASLLLVPSLTFAQANQHEGFFLRMTLGPAVGATSYGDAPLDYRTRGTGGMTEVAVGYTVAPNLILHANLHLAHLSGDRKLGRSKYGPEDVSTLVGFFGGGATYYFMPINVYVSGAIGLGGLSQTQGPRHDDIESDTGFGSSLSLGKEWWLGPHSNWALGAALVGSYYQAPLELDGRHSTYRGHALGLVFSSTYN